MNKTSYTITLLFLPILTLLYLSACTGKNSRPFIKTASGLQYQVYRTGGGDVPGQGQFLRMQVQQYYNDSLLSDTRKSIPQCQEFDSVQMSRDAYEIFSRVRVGDSLVFKLPSDSAFKTSKPAFATKKGWLITHVKIESIFRSADEAKADLDLQKAKFQPPGQGSHED